MNIIDGILNRVTMYRVVLYYLLVLVALAVILAALGVLPYSPVALIFSAAAFAFASLVANAIFARAYDAVPGTDSTLITALILALIMDPVAPGISGALLICAVSFWAIASKYVIAWKRKHIFNPAAFGVALAALLLGHGATWWVGGNLWLAPVVIGGGLLIVRKLQRFDLVISFAIVAIATIALTALTDPLANVLTTLAHSSFFFLAFVMLTEPVTMPPGRTLRAGYAAIVGFLFAPAIHLFSFYFTPETALLAANAFSFVVSPKDRRILTLVARHKLAAGVYEFVFRPDAPLPFRAGQYLEWTLPGAGSDTRGNRRYFTIASAPSEREIRLAVKFYTPMSTFKQKLIELQPGETVSVSSLAGSFTLPKDTKRKLAFIAGGIGITPFRSMIGEMLETGTRRDAILLYSNNVPEDIAYADVFDTAASELGMKTVYATRIDPAEIARDIPDYRDRMFYISGPRGMVVSFRKSLRALGIRSSHIKVDYFPGFA